MFYDSNSYKRLASALAPLMLDDKVYYLPVFECCRNCAQHRIELQDWGNARGVATFNVQTKVAADDFGQLELSIIGNHHRWGSDGETDAKAQTMVDAHLQEGGFRKLQDEHEPAEGNSFLRVESSFLIFGNFEGDAELDPEVLKIFSYGDQVTSPYGDSVVVEYWPSEYSARRAEELHRVHESFTLDFS